MAASPSSSSSYATTYSSVNPKNGTTRVFPHIRDIIAISLPKLSEHATLKDYLVECETCAAASKNGINFGRPDVAFRNYLTAQHVMVMIQKHKEYGFLLDNNMAWASRLRNVKTALSKIDPQMDGVRREIEANNARFRTKQQSTPETSKTVTTEASTAPVAELPESLTIGRPHPQAAPKPEQLKGHPLSNDLHSRLARLRIANPAVAMPDPANFQTDSILPKPQGPREMPPPPTPTKVPILMPKPPSPTYSPVSVVPNGVESSRPPMERRQQYYNHPLSPAQPLQKIRDDNPYRPRTPNGSAMTPKSNSSDIPHHTMITATTLADYIQRYHVLLVDVRDRTLFDEGHIFARSIICIEPITLKEGVSAEELEERLILSPETELVLFSRRNEFDLVVYYDQNTNDDAYLTGPPTHNSAPHLRAFYDTLYEFNDYKRLKDGRPPALLQGGIDSWVDIMSVQSLMVSKTAATLGVTRQRGLDGGRPLGRQRMASANSRYEIRNRRLRSHKFLDENEQAVWRQKAQQEQVTTNQEQSSDGEYEEQVEPDSPFVADYESFLRRFPAVDQQSMVMAAPRRLPLQSPPPLPPAPPHLPSQLPPPVPRYEPIPEIPTRPAPAIPRPSYHGQSEITQPQAPLARVASSTKQPLYSSAMAARTRKIPRTGLTNFGVTCYMNSVLQCLSATIPLATFFMDETVYRSNLQKNWKGSSGIMPDIFANVVRSLWKGDVQVIKPSTFRNFCGRMNREWVIDRQQDAKEFFDFLVDCLHEDLNFNWQRTQLRPLTEAEEMSREKFPIPQAGPIEWGRYEHRDYSFISSLFAGQHASRLRCLACRNTSTTYEAFYSISVEIPKTGTGDIYQCLRSYTQEEQLSELWKCPYCKGERQATKQIILTRLPQFLVIHFKRFSASKTEKARKIHTPVDFPLHDLLMDPFIIPGNPSVHGAGPSEDNRKLDPATAPPFNYDAYGVLRHIGSSGDGGHYVSIVKDPGRGCWRKFDDQVHQDLDPTRLAAKDRLQNQEAYIVFFQRAPAR